MRFPLAGHGWLYFGLTAFLAPLPFLVFIIGQMHSLSALRHDGLAIIFLMLGGSFLVWAVSAALYLGIFHLLARLGRGPFDWQVILLYLVPVPSLFFFLDWSRRADKIDFPALEIALPIAGLLASWVVFRVAVHYKRIESAKDGDL